MKKIIVLSACTMLFALLTQAQDSAVTLSKNKYVQLDVGIGYLNTQMDKINTSFKSAGLRPMKENYATLSVASSFFLNRIMFRSEASFILPNHVDQPNNMNTEFSGYTIGVTVGYAVIQNPRFRLYPYAGINAFNTYLQFHDFTPVTDMNELLNTPLHNARIRYSNAALDLGIQIDKIITLRNDQWDCPQNNRYMTIGVRAGYNLSPGRVKASYNGAQLEGAPEYSFKGPYVKLVIGMGTKLRKLQWK